MLKVFYAITLNEYFKIRHDDHEVRIKVLCLFLLTLCCWATEYEKGSQACVHSTFIITTLCNLLLKIYDFDNISIHDELILALNCRGKHANEI